MTSRKEALSGLCKELDARALLDGTEQTYIPKLIAEERYYDAGILMRAAVDDGLVDHLVTRDEARQWYAILPPPKGRAEMLRRLGERLRLGARDTDTLTMVTRPDVWDLAEAEQFLAGIVDVREKAGKLSPEDAQQIRHVLQQTLVAA
ncbi:MAG TPA: hypothetical protein VHC20_05000 [Candidatus Paceibacterota bacterium]|nr:hypothetical protein [Candidatus Paceibacterota bacterium]